MRDFSSPRYFEHRKSELGEELPGDRLIPMTEQPEDVLVMVAGGQGAGAHKFAHPIVWQHAGSDGGDILISWRL